MKRRVKCTNLLQAKEEFLKQKQIDGITKTSIANYEVSIDKFINDTKAEEITQEVLDEWKYSLMHSDLSSSSVAHYLREMRAFVNWLGIDVKINIPKMQEDKIKFYTDEEIELLLEKPNKDCSYTDYRTWVIVCFIMATGARAGTCVELQIDDIDTFNGEVRYSHTKNKRAQIMPLSQSITKILKDYMNEWELGNKYLFCDRCGNKMTVPALRQSVDKLCIKKGVEPKGVHSLRHTFARMSIKNGVNALVLQRMLGHSTLDMTNHYVNLFSEDLRDSVNMYSPLDCIKQSNKIRRRA